MLADNNIDSRANNDVELYSCSYLMPMYWKEKTCFRQRLKDHQKKKVIQSALKQSIITTRAIHEHIQETLYTLTLKLEKFLHTTLCTKQCRREDTIVIATSGKMDASWMVTVE